MSNAANDCFLLFVVLVLSVLAAPFSHADTQRPLTLPEAIQEALQGSPDIQRVQAVAEEDHWKKYEALGTGFLPKISATANHYFDVTKYQFSDIVFAGQEIKIPGVYPNNQVSLNAMIPIFDGLANVHRLQAASLTEDASNRELDSARFGLAEKVSLAFDQALAAVALEDVANENVKTLEDHLNQVQVQRKGGTATRYDMLRVQVQLSEAKSDQTDAHDNVLLTRKKLTALLGLDADARPLQGELPVPDTSKIQNMEISAVPADRADLLAMDLRAEAADKARSAQNAWFIPNVGLGAQFSYYNLLLYNNQIIDNHHYQTAYNLGVFLTWNLFDGGVAYTQSREADARRTQAEKSAESARIQVPYDFAYWKKRYLSNADHFQAKQLDVTLSEESVRLAKEEERAGTRNSTEVLDAELDLFRSRAGVVNAQVNAAEALINLELVLGKVI